MSSPLSAPTYPAIRFIAKHGDLLALAIALVCLAAGIWAVAAGCHWVFAVLGLGVGAVLWLVVRSYVEVLRILSDTLMPR